MALQQRVFMSSLHCEVPWAGVLEILNSHVCVKGRNSRGGGEREQWCEFYRCKIHQWTAFLFEEVCLVEDHYWRTIGLILSMGWGRALLSPRSLEDVAGKRWVCALLSWALTQTGLVSQSSRRSSCVSPASGDSAGHRLSRSPVVQHHRPVPWFTMSSSQVCAASLPKC